MIPGAAFILTVTGLLVLGVFLYPWFVRTGRV